MGRLSWPHPPKKLLHAVPARGAIPYLGQMGIDGSSRGLFAVEQGTQLHPDALMRLAARLPVQPGHLSCFRRACLRALCAPAGAASAPGRDSRHPSAGIDPQATAGPGPRGQSTSAPPPPPRAGREMPIRDTIELTELEQQLFNDLLEAEKEVGPGEAGGAAVLLG